MNKSGLARSMEEARHSPTCHDHHQNCAPAHFLYAELLQTPILARSPFLQEHLKLPNRCLLKRILTNMCTLEEPTLGMYRMSKFGLQDADANVDIEI